MTIEDPGRPNPTVPKVFISSTHLDNAKRRELVHEAVLRAEMYPVCMERFTASDMPPVDTCQQRATDADIFVLILAHRYGSIPEGHEYSFTELEYDSARRARRHCLIFVLSETEKVLPNQDFDTGEDRWDKQKHLDRFKAKVRSHHTVRTFKDDTLPVDVLSALQQWKADQTQNSAVPTPSTSLHYDELTRYRGLALALHSNLVMAGFATRLRVPLDLEQLYVPLRGLVDARGVDEPRHFADAVEAERRLAGQCADIPLVDAFKQATAWSKRALVILGDPGSGKTTHLKRLLLFCLRQGSQSLGLDPQLVPVFVALREWNDQVDVADFVAEQIDRQFPEIGAGFGARLLESRERTLLLFDGLDEVADARQRERVAKGIDRMLAKRSDCVGVVSCRFAGYGDDIRFGDSFLELHVRPLSREQSESFIGNWYQIVESALQPAHERVANLKRAREKADDLIARLRDPDHRSARLVAMTRNPLLLANLCLVHHDRGSLPRKRARLYGECIDVLLEHWQQGKRLCVDVSAEDGRLVLQPAALWLHAEPSRDRATAEELAPVLDPALAAIQYSGGGAREFLRTIRDASGLLTGFSQNQYGFMHLGFQEFLAASELRRRMLEGHDAEAFKLVADGYGKSWWQEVILVLVALGNPSAFVPLMREVVRRPAFAEHPELLELIFEDAAEVSPQPFLELLDQAPGADVELWNRQLTALRVVARRFAPALKELVPRIEQHPHDEVRAWLAQYTAHEVRAAAGGELLVAGPAAVELVLIPSGTFRMGSPETELARDDDETPPHRVTLRSFYLARSPVTNEQYEQFLKANPDIPDPAYWSDRRFNQDRQPVVGVRWENAARFAAWAGGRLPTEAEWEYACRAGTTRSRYGGLSAIAWFEANSGSVTHPVEEKLANAFGLYDMLGNVGEWCADWYAPYSADAASDPCCQDPPADVRGRVVRGGGWGTQAKHVRAAFRRSQPSDAQNAELGFRIARDLNR